MSNSYHLTKSNKNQSIRKINPSSIKYPTFPVRIDEEVPDEHSTQKS